MATLSDRLDHVLGNSAATALEEAFGLRSVEDLLRHYPHRYAKRGEWLAENRPQPGEHITVIATVKSAELRPIKSAAPQPIKPAATRPTKSRSRKLLKLVLQDGTNTIDATFFNPRLAGLLRPGVRAMFSGSVKYFHDRLQLTHPSYLLLPQNAGDTSAVAASGRVIGGGELAEIAKAAHGDDPAAGAGLAELNLPVLCVYPATGKLQSWVIWNCVRQVLDQLDPVPDPLPERVRREHGLLSLDEALRIVHLPDTTEIVRRAHDRLRFDEAVSLQLGLAQKRHEQDRKPAPACPVSAIGIAADFEQLLPFELTEGQHLVRAEFAADLAQSHPMNRLLQGEVGSGKTVLALMAMLQAIDAGHQCALLAPTEVLAAQHYRSLRTLLGPLGIAGELGAAATATKVTLLTGSMGVGAKRAALLEIVSGEAGIVIGTHALIQDHVEFCDLGLLIVDEQHRFGVEQRDALRGRGRDGAAAHLLVMTATPIPRTVAMTVFGDLDVSTLRELPRGRSPIVTRVIQSKVRPTWVDRAWARIGEEVAEGRQAYVVCSRIGSEEDGGADEQRTQAAEQLFDELRTGPLAHVRVGLLHGRLPTDAKDRAMTEFTGGEIDVLVCTTVVEVGVDVPNATVMVIVDADRFGVSQLHQLRGRVGRGRHQGLCLLMSDMAPPTPAMLRLEAVAATNDGFELAQLDLEQRREGDVLGDAQSGVNRSLRLLSLLRDAAVIDEARVFARSVVAADPALAEHPGLASMVSSVLDPDRIDYLEKS